MRTRYLALCVALLLMLFSGFAMAGSVNEVPYASLTGTEVVSFEDLPQIDAPGSNYDSIFASGGAGFAERFVGQTLTASGNFDVLSGSPSGSLALQVGAPGRNINIFAGTYGGVYGNVLDGLGGLGYPDYDAIGEGSFAVLFSTDQSEFGFELVGGNGGNAYISFFNRSGGLIDFLTISGLSDTYYGFPRLGGIQDIAGISIYNDDGAGIGFDNLRHDVASDYTNTVPEPSALILLGSGILVLLGARKRIL
jgi:hypothetical protein